MCFYCGCSSIGRAIAFQAIGCGFKPRQPLKDKPINQRSMDEQLAKALRKLNGNTQYQMPESRNFYFFFNEELVKSVTEAGKTELHKLLDELKLKNKLIV